MKIADVCSHVPAHAPRDFHEALQYYWFCHLAVITELNGWDSFNPGHLDQHLLPFYEQGLADGTLTREARPRAAGVLLHQVQQPSRAAQGRRHRGRERHLHRLRQHQPRRPAARRLRRLERGLAPPARHRGRDAPAAAQHATSSSRARARTPSSSTPCASSARATASPRSSTPTPWCRSNSARARPSKTRAPAAAAAASRSGAFGKEAYILTGYFNLVKVLELTLHNGVDPRTGKQLGLQTGEPESFGSFDDLFAAFRAQLHHFLDIKLRGNQLIERMYADADAGAVPVRAHRRLHPQGQGLQRRRRPLQQHATSSSSGSAASPTASRRSSRWSSTSRRPVALADLVATLDADFAGHEPLRQRLLNRTHKYGNDDDYADDLMVRVFNACFEELDGRPNTKGGRYRVEMLPTTCHVYFGSVTGAMPDGRKAGLPLSEGISPVQGADRHGPTAVIKSAAKMDHVKTGGTLLNMKFTPALLADEDGIDKLGAPGAQLLQDGRPPRAVQRGPRRDAARGPGRPGAPPRPDRPRGRLQRLLLRPLARAAGGDHRPHGARGVLSATLKDSPLPPAGAGQGVVLVHRELEFLAA